MANLNHELPSNDARDTSVKNVDLKREAVVIPVSDVDGGRSSMGTWGGGSTPTSPSITASGSSSSRRPARDARSNSARCSVQFCTNFYRPRAAAPGNRLGRSA